MASDPLLRSRRCWRWGLVVIADVGASDVPEVVRDQLVVGTRQVVLCGIMHEIDGEATAEVVLGFAPEGLEGVYDSFLDVASGQIELGDAAGESVETAQIAPGTWRIRVYVDDGVEPERVVVRLTPTA